MGKIHLTKEEKSKINITLPGDVLFYLYNKKVKYVYYGLTFTDDDYYTLVITNIYNYRFTHLRKKFFNLKVGFTKVIPDSYIKTNRYKIVNDYFLDYNIIEDNFNNFIIFAKFKLKNSLILPYTDMSEIHKTLTSIFGSDYFYEINKITNKNLKDNDISFVHSINNDIVYFTESKLVEATLKSYIENLSFDNLLNYSRSMSLTKFVNTIYPNHNVKILQKYIEYNKWISNYDSSMFDIVKGNDILKYYLEDNYYNKSGDLGSSCMRNENYQNQIEFYAKNENISLIILKAKDSDTILGRSLLWTTTEGVKVMDRIYTCNSKIVSFFHKYAEENNFLNIYNIKVTNGKRDLTAMSPAYWKAEYTKNYIVDLDYLPKEFLILKMYDKIRLAYNVRQTSVSNSYKFPYLDNFNLINGVTKQISLMPIDNTFICNLTNEVIPFNKYEKDDQGNVYHSDYVEIIYGKAKLKVDEVVLDKNNTENEKQIIDTELLSNLAEPVITRFLDDSIITTI
jgi:hypothetical protein